MLKDEYKDKKVQLLVSEALIREVSKVVKDGKRAQVLRACLLLYARRHDFRQTVDTFIEKMSVGTI